MYDTFSAEYDRFVNWDERLAFEMPFILNEVNSLQRLSGQPLDILDTACGTGMHAIALARLGHHVSAADLYPQMVVKGNENARKNGVQVHFEAAGFGKLARTFPGEQFDLLLCLGNSLPHLLTVTDLRAAMEDFAACLRPGGMLLIQNRNFDVVMQRQERWMEPQSSLKGDTEWVFQRFYDFLPGGMIRFNIVILKRAKKSGWQASVVSTNLRPQLKAELEHEFAAAGFTAIQAYGSMKGDPFSPSSSGNLILTAIRKQGINSKC